MAEAALIAASLAVSAYSTYSQHQASVEANNEAEKTIKAQEDEQKKADQGLETAMGKNAARATQDASWMQLKTLQNSAAGLQGAAPYSLTSQTAAAGAAAGSKAGKLPQR